MGAPEYTCQKILSSPGQKTSFRKLTLRLCFSALERATATKIMGTLRDMHSFKKMNFKDFLDLQCFGYWNQKVVECIFSIIKWIQNQTFLKILTIQWYISSYYYIYIMSRYERESKIYTRVSLLCPLLMLSPS